MYSHDTPVAGSISSVGHPSMLKVRSDISAKRKRSGRNTDNGLDPKEKGLY